ncbi:MAG TPA: pilus assembly protein TadG-related protein [Candidatus Angelobacter sp.]|jgi:hypothetical protein|nr:pilus assembly protein TadG-related protein [Candidatus Angelobacter sp.]
MQTSSGQRRRSVRGQVTIMMVGLYVGLFVLAGAAVDGGRAFAAKVRAIGEAQEAARAGANTLSQRSLYTGGSDVDPTRAAVAARAYLVADGYSGTVTVNGTTVHVTVTLVQPTTLWRAVGIDSLTLTETGSADALRSSG